ncbi:hypothetical protein GH714_021368 [Hevea brasiliensis]|uniref:Endoplasmic reticulum transmembrane protein n=1 Tax=Hevea brasiliensis TaxID=3981 RepID=A0A6A6LUI8_HEVBR|nr:hypothetical protein GH714_021368 [Hevea brasiliensis]
MALIMVLVFKTPLRKLVLMSLDRVKRGHGPIVVKTVAGRFFGVDVKCVQHNEDQKRWIDEGAVNPTDQVLMAKHLLEATLMGSSLFLALSMDRLHHYIKELRIRRKSMDAAKKQNRVIEDGKVEESKVLKKR